MIYLFRLREIESDIESHMTQALRETAIVLPYVSVECELVANGTIIAVEGLLKSLKTDDSSKYSEWMRQVINVVKEGMVVTKRISSRVVKAH